MSDHFILISTDDKNDPTATVCDSLEALDRALEGVPAGDPQHIVIQGGRVVRFSRPPAKLVIEGDAQPKKTRKPRSDTGKPRKTKDAAQGES